MTRLRLGYGPGNLNIVAPSLQHPSSRGGSGTNALTNTLDPSLYPTTPPPSNFDSGVPKIGGSEGGFIGLIVGLGVLIILCGIAVFYLLHTRPHGGRAGNRNHPFSSSSSSAPGIFTSMSKRNAGWVQQNDEFDYDSGEDDDLGTKGSAARYGDGGSGYTGKPTQDAKLKALSSPPVLSRGENMDDYTDPFDPERLPESVRKQQAPLPTTLQNSRNVPNRTAEHSPTESLAVPFEGGTKFKEQF